MEGKDLRARISASPKGGKVAKKPVSGCKCKENLIAAINIRGDFSKGEKDRIRDAINQEMK